jgi:hypothetical protein
MADSRRIVESVLETDPVIKKGLERGIINSRALARFIRKTTRVEATPDAILGYIRRYPVDGEDSTEYGLVLKDSDIKMKSKVGVLEIDHGPQIMRQISEFASTVKTARGENLRVLCGTRCIRVIADQKALAQFSQTLLDKEIIQYAENLVEVSLLLSPAAEHADDIYNRITAQLAMNDLRAIAILFCGPEAILIVREEDSVRALEVLQEMLSDTSGAVS